MGRDDKKSELIRFIEERGTILVFDVDGVLAPFEYGVHCHNACLDSKWDTYIQTHDVYGNTRPVRVLQELIRKKDPGRIFVCSQANVVEKPGKKKFVTDHYGVLENHIYFVRESLDKLECLREIHQTWFPQLRQEQIVLIDDTVKILNHVQENSQYATVHVSSFLE